MKRFKRFQLLKLRIIKLSFEILNAYAFLKVNGTYLRISYFERVWKVFEMVHRNSSYILKDVYLTKTMSLWTTVNSFDAIAGNNV